jgi:hypothetical protein
LDGSRIKSADAAYQLREIHSAKIINFHAGTADLIMPIARAVKLVKNFTRISPRGKPDAK